MIKPIICLLLTVIIYPLTFFVSFILAIFVCLLSNGFDTPNPFISPKTLYYWLKNFWVSVTNFINEEFK
jgi:hypothetical protein